MKQLFSISFVLTLLIFGGCRSPLELTETGALIPADISADEFIGLVPDYSETLDALSGSGRALVSQPEGSDRVTLDFHSDREASLITIRNRIGIEGGQILVENDSLLVYNRVEKTAEKISLKDADLTEAGTLASINFIELFHYPVSGKNITGIWQDERHYVAATADGTRITIDKWSGHVLDLQIPPGTGAPYSRINYEGYEQLDDFYLPRKITVFSSDGGTRVTLLVRRLQVNRPLPALEIEIPDDIPVLII